MVPTDIHYNNEMEVNERVNLLCANMTGTRIDSNAISIFVVILGDFDKYRI